MAEKLASTDKKHPYSVIMRNYRNLKYGQSKIGGATVYKPNGKIFLECMFVNMYIIYGPCSVSSSKKYLRQIELRFFPDRDWSAPSSRSLGLPRRWVKIQRHKRS